MYTPSVVVRGLAIASFLFPGWRRFFSRQVRPGSLGSFLIQQTIWVRNSQLPEQFFMFYLELDLSEDFRVSFHQRQVHLFPVLHHLCPTGEKSKTKKHVPIDISEAGKAS